MSAAPVAPFFWPSRCCLPAPRPIPPPARRPATAGRDAPTGVFGDYLAGRFAMTQADPQTAATQLPARAAPPSGRRGTAAAGVHCLPDRRPYRGGAACARQLPDSQAAQLLLGRRRGPRRPLAGGGAEVPRAAAPGPDAVAAAAAGGLGAAGRRPRGRRAGHAPPVPRRPAVPRRLRPACRADRRPGRPHRGRRASSITRRRPNLAAPICAWRRSWRAGRPATASWARRSAHLDAMADAAPEMAIALPGLIAASNDAAGAACDGWHRRGLSCPGGHAAPAGLPAISP